MPMPIRRCCYCGQTKARTIVARGWAHRRCAPKEGRPARQEELTAVQLAWLEDPRPYCNLSDRTFTALRRKGFVVTVDADPHPNSKAGYRVTPAGDLAWKRAKSRNR